MQWRPVNLFLKVARAAISLTFSLLVETLADHGKCHNWGRRDARGAAFCTEDRLQAVVGPGDGALVSLPDGHETYVVLVVLPLFSSPLPPVGDLGVNQSIPNLLYS